MKRYDLHKVTYNGEIVSAEMVKFPFGKFVKYEEVEGIINANKWYSAQLDRYKAENEELIKGREPVSDCTITITADTNQAEKALERLKKDVDIVEKGLDRITAKLRG